MNLEASLHSLLLFAWTLTRPTNYLRQILFCHTRRWYQFLFLNLFFIFRFFFLLFYVILLLLIFTKTMLLLSFYLINFFFSWKLLLFFHFPGMFRHLPECFVFRVLWTPICKYFPIWVIPNSKLITISNNVLPKHLSWNSTWTQRAVIEFSAPREKKGDNERIA